MWLPVYSTCNNRQRLHFSGEYQQGWTLCSFPFLAGGGEVMANILAKEYASIHFFSQDVGAVDFSQFFSIYSSNGRRQGGEARIWLPFLEIQHRTKWIIGFTSHTLRRCFPFCAATQLLIGIKDGHTYSCPEYISSQFGNKLVCRIVFSYFHLSSRIFDLAPAANSSFPLIDPQIWFP